MPEQTLAYFLNCSTLAVIAFSVHLLLLRARQQQVYLALAGCLLALALLICQPVLTVLAPQLRLVALLLALPALYLIPPLFWFYVKGLTSSVRWRFQRTDAKHFGLAALGLLIVAVTLLLPAEVRHALVVEGRDDILQQVSAPLRYLVYTLAMCTFLLVIGWVLQAAFYVHAVFRRLQLYRAQLRQVFASTEAEEARWIGWLLLAVGGAGSLFAAGLWYDNLIAPLPRNLWGADLLTLLLVWSVALWGLRQKPGFALLQAGDHVMLPLAAVALQATEQRDLQDLLQAVSDGKYQRSALGAEQAASIAGKLQQAMEQDQLYLDAALSLPKLARHIGCSPNYISQTLNATLGLNFFDYVNRYRVQAAAMQLRDTDLSVLDVAMNVGFNAKSSFYTAFKKELQQTPSQYRATHMKPQTR